MALIICYECSKEISDTSKRCPECGAKNLKRKNNIKVFLLSPLRLLVRVITKRPWVSMSIAILIILFASYVTYSSFLESKRTDNPQREITQKMRNDGYTGKGTWNVFNDKYVGDFMNGKMHGQGIMYYKKDWFDERADGRDKYVGEFKDDLPNGQGTLTCKGRGFYLNRHNDKVSFDVSGNKYVGAFKDGNFHGQGTYTWGGSDVAQYAGQWKDGEFHGQGIFTWDDGYKYVGEFKDGYRHGQGTYTNKRNSKEEKGIWEDDKYVRKGIIIPCSTGGECGDKGWYYSSKLPRVTCRSCWKMKPQEEGIKWDNNKSINRKHYSY